MSVTPEVPADDRSETEKKFENYLDRDLKKMFLGYLTFLSLK